MSKAQDSKIDYTVVVPIFKDADLLDDFCIEFHRVFAEFTGSSQIDERVEFLVVSDSGGRSDEEIIRQLCAKHKFLKAILLSRNFGQHNALTAGYNNAKGRYTGMLNVDQQDPISELPKFFNHLETEKLDIVYGLRKERKDAFLKN